MRNKMTMCCCYGIEENPCLIHSSIEAKADPWPEFVLESGDAPAEEGDGYTFATPGKIRFDHDDIMHWDGSDFVTGRSDFATKDRKRFVCIIELTSDDACVEITIMDDGVESSKFRFVAHTPAIAKYPIVSALRYTIRNNSYTSGEESSTQETILDRWQESYQIKFYSGSTWTDGTSTVPGSPAKFITAMTPVYLAFDSDLHPIGYESWSYNEWDDDDSTSIWIECITGSAVVKDVELYHDPYQFNVLNTLPVTDPDGPTCLPALTVPNQSTLCNANGLFLNNSIPASLYLTLPTLTDNPDAEVFASTCADCTAGGGEVVRLFVAPADVLALELFCEYQSNDAHVACNDTETGVNYARFYPWFTNEGAGIIAIDYEQDGDSEILGGDIETLPGDQCPFAYVLAYFDGDQCSAVNCSVVLDHIGVSGIMTWQEWDNNTFACKLNHGEVVFIELTEDWDVA